MERRVKREVARWALETSPEVTMAFPRATGSGMGSALSRSDAVAWESDSALQVEKIAPYRALELRRPQIVEQPPTCRVLAASIPAPENSPYRGAVFVVHIDIPADYPFRPPVLRFAPPVPPHPNVYPNGSISLELLGSNWSPAVIIPKALVAVQALLENPNYIDRARNVRTPEEHVNAAKAYMLKCQL